MNDNFNFSCLQYKATSDKLWIDKPNHFRVYLFVLASTDSTVLVAISYTNSSHNNIKINICCRHQTLNFSCKGQWSTLWRPSCNVLDVSFTWLISFKDSSNQRPKFFTGSSDTVGILWPPILKFIILINFFFPKQKTSRLLGFEFHPTPNYLLVHQA